MTFKRAIVTAVAPLRIILDGDTVAVPFTPESLIDPATLAVDDVVRAELSGNRLVVLGRVGGLVLSDASTSVKGIVELATDAETITGTDTVRAVTPAGLAAVIDDSGWAAPTLLNSWASFGGSLQTPRYRRINGYVHIEGIIKAGTINTIFTLPVGFRPPLRILFLVACNAGGLQVYVKSNGDVTAVAYISGGSNALVSLSGISFAVS